MVCSHRCSAEEGTSAPLLPETAEEVWNEPQNPQIHIVGGELPSLQDIYTRHVQGKPGGSSNGAFPLHGTVRFGTVRYGSVRVGCISTAV